MLGPTYETRAEVRMLAKLGPIAAACPLFLRQFFAKAEGLRVLGISCVTNWAGGISGEPLSQRKSHKWPHRRVRNLRAC